MSDIMTAPEAARLCDVHPETIRKAIRDGVLPEHKFGAAYVLNREDVERWNKSRKPAGNPNWVKATP